MKKRLGRIGILCFIICIACCGCKANVSEESNDEARSILTASESTEEVQDTEEADLIQQYGLDILPVVCVEAGTECLTGELFFDSYSGQELSIHQGLSLDELAVCGASYLIPVTYQGYDLEIEVDIIDTIPPSIVKLDDILIKAGDSVSYKKAVEISDNSSNELSLSIDNSAVDVQTPGVYSVVYTVTDAGGNSSSVEATLTVVEATSHTEEDVKELALKVIEDVVDENDSQYDKALALFKWVHSNIRYQHSAGDRSSVWAGAYEGLHDNAGDCYAFYATYAVLLTYAGIDNECVARVSDSSHHWWNLVNIGEGWYHCDASPRRNGDGYYCFMQTDEQVAAYTRAYPEKSDYYTFDASLLPERATTIIYGYDPDTIYEKYNTEAVNKRLAEIKEKEEAEKAAEEAPEEGENSDDDNTPDEADAADGEVESSGESINDESGEETVSEGDNPTASEEGSTEESKKKKKKKTEESEAENHAEDEQTAENAQEE